MISLRRLNRLVSLKAFGKRFADDGRGVSAIEFALVAPVLILLYLGMAELTLGMMASRRVSHLASTIGDLAAQSQTLTPDNIADLWKIGANMLDPNPTDGASLRMRLTSVTMSSESTPRAMVDWSQASNLAEYEKNKELSSITTKQISPGESLILTEVEYDYKSPLGNLFKSGTVFKETYTHHPRNGAQVTCPLCN
ncbi:TadE/TadG family type IV pilus assembly protein [Asticcacaulis sp.]|uniref:TadE/TadG family type IV pilus assembly protein n=1 Tax=Asticcacaulis sp. TaxID=1872648 RepID=UPI002B68F1A5|nr:TadE/TadG family type IV pilus assembly protein [Asticcacaulis sp.]HTM80585.1 TadE/TadG family type IV pilus assembly protein [Asticcacaulis sp.]